MPRYFFDTYNGDLFLPGDKGIELENLEAVKAEAFRALPHMARDKLPEGDQRAFVVSVGDEAGEVVYGLRSRSSWSTAPGRSREVYRGRSQVRASVS